MPAKKRKIIQKFLFGTVAQTAESSSEPLSVQQCGGCLLLESFAKFKWKKRFSWLELLSDEVYRTVCAAAKVAYDEPPEVAVKHYHATLHRHISSCTKVAQK